MKKIIFLAKWICFGLGAITYADILFVTDYSTPGHVYAFNATTGVLLNPQPYLTIPNGDQASDLAIYGTTVFVSDNATPGKIYAFNALTGASLNPIPFATSPFGGSLGVSEETILVTSGGVTTPGTVYTFNALLGGAAQLFATVPGDPAFSIETSGNFAFVSVGNNNGHINTFPLNASPPVTATLFVTLPAGHHSNVLDTLGSSFSSDVLLVTDNQHNPGNVYAFSIPTGSPIPSVGVPFTTVSSSYAQGIASSETMGFISNDNVITPGTIFSYPIQGGAATFFATDPAIAGSMWLLPTTIQTTDLYSQTLKVAEQLNAVTNFLLNSSNPYSLANAGAILGLVPLTGKALKEALEYICPARNAFPIFAAANAQFAASDVAEDHQRQKRFVRRQRRRIRQMEESRPQQIGHHELLSEASEEVLLSAPSVEAAASPQEPGSFPVQDIYSPWIELFGEYAHQKAQKQSPSFNDSLGGAVLACDFYDNCSTTLFGAGLAYTYSYVHEGGGAGHAVINQEYAVVYATFEWCNKFYLDPALWGSLMQISNTRHIPTPSLTSNAKSHPTGWMLNPHLELGFDIDRCWWTIEPFAMFDWPNVWEHFFEEEGGGSFKVKQPSHHSSMLRSEVGFRFYQGIQTAQAHWTIQEKISYVNKKPFHIGAVTAFIIGAPGSFTVDTLSGMQNLGCGEIEFVYDPKNRCSPTISVSYQGETSFNASYFSHLGMVSLSKEF